MKTLPVRGQQIVLNHVYWTGLEWRLERLSAIVDSAAYTACKNVYGMALLTTGGGMDYNVESDGTFWHGSRRMPTSSAFSSVPR